MKDEHSHLNVVGLSLAALIQRLLVWESQGEAAKKTRGNPSICLESKQFRIFSLVNCGLHGARGGGGSAIQILHRNFQSETSRLDDLAEARYGKRSHV